MYYLSICCGLVVLVQLAAASTNCVLNSATLTCETSDFVAKYPDPEVSNRGIHADVVLTNGEGCPEGVVRNVRYEISVATQFDYSSMPMIEKPEGCNSKYEFQASNTPSSAYILTSFLPQNEDKKEVVSTLSFDKLEEGCDVGVSMNFVWVDSVSSTCALN